MAEQVRLSRSFIFRVKDDSVGNEVTEGVQLFRKGMFFIFQNVAKRIPYEYVEEYGIIRFSI
jgi:hypothetical protein